MAELDLKPVPVDPDCAQMVFDARVRVEPRDLVPPPDGAPPRPHAPEEEQSGG